MLHPLLHPLTHLPKSSFSPFCARVRSIFHSHGLIHVFLSFLFLVLAIFTPDVSPQAHGSAQIRVDGTEVIATIRADLGEPSRENPGQGRLICNVVWSVVSC